MNPAFPVIFARLRDLLERNGGSLAVAVDEAKHYCLAVPFNPKLKKRFPTGWVRIEKNYVSYHFMPIYMFPELSRGLSKKLLARMQGKSCFNFKTVDEALFKELERLTKRGFALAKKSGFGPK